MTHAGSADHRVDEGDSDCARLIEEINFIAMSGGTRASSRKPVVLDPGAGRPYPMGRIAALFKADDLETESRYSISEWWLEPHTQGPGAHSHPEDNAFYVIEGTMSVLVGDVWTHATRGSFILVPGGVTHDFENRGDVRAGVLNLFIPGAFESHMTGIAQWFAENPPKDAGI
jgi:mannose-6-phosphate isomerase-like protein (cupin superfamily)